MLSSYDVIYFVGTESIKMVRNCRVMFNWNGFGEEFIFPLEDRFGAVGSTETKDFISSFKNYIKDLRLSKFKDLPEAKFLCKEKDTNCIISPHCRLEKSMIGNIYLEVSNLVTEWGFVKVFWH